MVSTAEVGVQPMNKPSEDKATPVKGDQNKAKITKDELSEQELQKASGGSFSFGASNPAIKTDKGKLE